MGSLRRVDNNWFMDVNHFARSTPWAHPAMEFWAHLAGATFLGLLVLLAWWFARHSTNPIRTVSLALWAGIGPFIAYALAHYILKPVVAEKRPFVTLHGVEVLLTSSPNFSFPSGHATFAGAVIAGLWLARRHIIATIATIAGLLLAFGRVYVGVHYPWDVIGGLIIGAAVVLILYPIGIKFTTWLATFVSGLGPFRFLVVAGDGAQPRTISSTRKPMRL